MLGTVGGTKYMWGKVPIFSEFGNLFENKIYMKKTNIKQKPFFTR